MQACLSRGNQPAGYCCCCCGNHRRMSCSFMIFSQKIRNVCKSSYFQFKLFEKKSSRKLKREKSNGAQLWLDTDTQETEQTAVISCRCCCELIAHAASPDSHQSTQSDSATAAATTTELTVAPHQGTLTIAGLWVLVNRNSRLSIPDRRVGRALVDAPL